MQIKKEEKLKILVFSLCAFIAVFVGVICGFSLNNLKNDSKKLPDELKKSTNILLCFSGWDAKRGGRNFCGDVRPESQ